ncbi:MAG: group II intron reverse transcriptase/maturase [Burkholderiaceae bacterium]
MKARNGAGAKGLTHPAEDGTTTVGGNASGRIVAESAKSFPISKRQVWEAYKRVKANGGAAGVDGQTIERFEEDLSNNLYKLWNRLASGSYMPRAVRRVELPKPDGGTRPLGIPTVADRIAQTVVKQHLEPTLEEHFHEDSYGYRPGKSAHQALDRARRRCWDYAWVVDLDIKGFFDTIDHALMMRALERHTSERWILLYVRRWLEAPVELADGQTQVRTLGTPQGGVISPLLANLFLHYVFDVWMQRHHPDVPFERYADDALCHCRTRTQAEAVLARLTQRFADCGLTLHPQKTRLVYCKDDDRRGDHPHTNFDFLGFTFRARRSKNRWGKFFVNFSPGMSAKAGKRIRQEIHGWRLHMRSDETLEELARMYNQCIRGWVNYYTAFYKSAMYPTLRHLDRKLALWATRKYKRLRRHRRRASHWLERVARSRTGLFAHWHLLRGQTGMGRAG